MGHVTGSKLEENVAFFLFKSSIENNSRNKKFGNQLHEILTSIFDLDQMKIRLYK